MRAGPKGGAGLRAVNRNRTSSDNVTVLVHGHPRPTRPSKQITTLTISQFGIWYFLICLSAPPVITSFRAHDPLSGPVWISVSKGTVMPVANYGLRIHSLLAWLCWGCLGPVAETDGDLGPAIHPSALLFVSCRLVFARPLCMHNSKMPTFGALPTLPAMCHPRRDMSAQ